MLQYNTVGVAHMPDRESNKLPNTLEAFQMPKNTDVHTIPIIEKISRLEIQQSQTHILHIHELTLLPPFPLCQKSH